jgi:hypothetical protein
LATSVEISGSHSSSSRIGQNRGTGRFDQSTHPEEKLMEYMLLIYGDENAWNGLSKQEIESTLAAYGAYTQELIAAGVLRAGSELAPVTTATTVRVRNGKTLTTDGPFAETKEQLGGYYLIDAPNLDEAIKWAAKIPSALFGSIEIRPQVDNSPK